jgi:hypothetical protein
MSTHATVPSPPPWVGDGDLAVRPRRETDMLTVTPTAAEAVRELVAGSPVDDDGRLRFTITGTEEENDTNSRPPGAY